MLERIFFINPNGDLPPVPKSSALSYLRQYGRELKSQFVCPRWNVSQFVNQYIGRKHAVYSEAAESLHFDPLTPRDARVKAFVKCEKINLAKKPDPVPRIIQPRDPRFNLELGRYVCPLEKRLYSLMASLVESKLPVVAKGMNADEQGALMRSKWEQFTDPVAIGLDASRFDQHVAIKHLKFTDAIYKSYYQEDEIEYLNWMLNLRHHNEGTAKCKEGIIKYSVEGRRMSGDMDTSLGNCILMCAMTHALCKNLTIPFDYINNGDDLVLFTERRYARVLQARIPQWYKDMGFTMTVEPVVDVLEQVEFCQTKPLCVDGQWRMVRSASTCLSKDLHSIVPIRSVKDFSNWCSDISSCGLALNAGVPVLQSFYAALRRGVKGRVSSRSKFHPAYEGNGLFHLVRGLKHQPKVVEDGTRFSFWLSSGILPDEQIALEAVFDAWNLEYGDLEIPSINDELAPILEARPLG